MKPKVLFKRLLSLRSKLEILYSDNEEVESLIANALTALELALKELHRVERIT